MNARWLACLALVAWGVASVFACSSWEDGASPEDYYRPPSSDAGDPSGSLPDSGAIAAASGVVLVHAAAFPAFRVCFENFPELRPQPETKPMPNANVVGVEIGSLARIGPLDRAPGKVFILDESQVRTSPGTDDEPTCGERICDRGKPCVRFPNDYLVAGEIHEPLGTDRVHLLAIAGCGNTAFLDMVGVTSDECGPDWEPARGLLMARAVPLMPTSAATETTLPVQLVHISTPVDTFQRNGHRLDISFGALEGGAPAQPIASNPRLFEPASATTLDVDQSDEAFYGTYGFRIALEPEADGGVDASPTISVAQSLAEVQDLAEPRSIPTTYYSAASNYALLLLGDPRIAKTFPDGGLNLRYDPRRGVHLLAVPVREPSDAGPDDAATTDASTD